MCLRSGVGVDIRCSPLGEEGVPLSQKVTQNGVFPRERTEHPLGLAICHSKAVLVSRCDHDVFGHSPMGANRGFHSNRVFVLKEPLH